MSAHNYTAAEFPGLFAPTFSKKAILAGYTNPVWTNSGVPAQPITLTVDETVDRSVLRDDINDVVLPALTVDVVICDIAGDGVATGQITVTDSRGAGAAGKTINLKPGGGPLVATPGSQALDGNGAAVFTFGPTWAASVCSGLIPVSFVLADDSALGTSASVRFTG